MKKYKGRPTEFEAVQFSGENRAEILKFAFPKMSKTALEGATIMRLPVIIESVFGEAQVGPSQWVIKNRKKELFMLTDEDFQELFEPVE